MARHLYRVRMTSEKPSLKRSIQAVRSYLVARPRLAPRFCYSLYKWPPPHTHISLYIHLSAKASIIFPTDANTVTLVTTLRYLPSPHATSLVVVPSLTLFGNTFAMPLALAPRLVLYSPINP